MTSCRFSMRKWTLLLIVLLPSLACAKEYNVDVCVYGGTASGVTAALAARARGASVLVIEPHKKIGGIVGGGIRIRKDCQYFRDIGGIARELHDADSQLGGPGSADSGQLASREMLAKLLEEKEIQVLTEHRLGKVVKEGNLITALQLDYAPVLPNGAPAPKAEKENVVTVKATMYVDASYEGDLLARAGVDYTIGREARKKYGEPLAGQRGLQVFDVSPYVVPDDPQSGLLPMIEPAESYQEGEASRHCIAYNFRLQFVPKGKGLPIGQPEKIDKKHYALLIRCLESPRTRKFLYWPQKNYARNHLLSSGIPGRQSDYPDADWPERSKIWTEWIEYIKTINSLTGAGAELKKGEYPDTNGFPDQLYIRLARRMVGEYVMTQKDLMHQSVINDSIGLGFYGVDIYPTRLVATADGKTATEGAIFLRISPGPYKIAYRSLLPKKEQCGNLIVPVCISASHVALASIRMESTYIVMGEAAGAAAALAARKKIAAADLDATVLQKSLTDAGAVLEWDGKEYGPSQRGYHWKATDAWWLREPETCKKFGVQFAPSWKNYTPKNQAKRGITKWSYGSRAEWDAAKPEWKFLFDFIDKDKDGKLSEKEYRAFQQYKKDEGPKWPAKVRDALKKHTK